MFESVHNAHLPQFMSPVLEPRALAVDALSQDRQGRLMYMFPPILLLNKIIQKLQVTQAAKVIMIAPWWSSQPWFPHLLSTPTTTVLSTPPRSTVSAVPGIHLGWKVVPSARMEALMRHYKAAGFSDEMSRLATATRRPSTNRMYNDRWLHFSNWAIREGFDRLIPSAAQIAAFITHFLILMAYHLKLSKAIEPVWAQCLTRQAKLQWFSTRLSLI